jgi:hypothetical protein
MKRFSRLLVGTVAASLFASPILARPGGGGAGGGGGGLVGGIVGGVTGTLSNTLGGVGATVGGTVNGALGGVRNVVGGVTGGGLLSSTRSGLLGGGSGGGALGGIGSVGSRGSISGGGAGGGSGSSGLNTMFTMRGPLGEMAALDQVSGQLDMENASPTDIESYREARLAALIAAYPAILDRDNNGDPVRKREVIATNPDPRSLALAAHAGFQIIGDESESGLGIRVVTLAIPKRMNVRQAMKTIRKTAPALQVDFNHVYEPSGGALLPVAGARLAAAAHHKPHNARATRAAPAPKPATRIAMIDGGIASHPSLAQASIVQQGFAGAAQATGHGTAVGSLLVGDQGPFRGAARGAQLFVADVYGGSPAAGSVTSIVKALNWAASKNPSVINISLVGPNNAALARAIAAIQARGIAVVAAVGNDGPAAPAQYPASYPGVVSVTGVDAHGRALREAGVSKHLDFAAPGADMVAAYPGNGYLPVRGTSFAAPLAAARLALTGSYQRLVQEARPGEGRVGRGIVCGQCRVDPKYLRK